MRYEKISDLLDGLDAPEIPLARRGAVSPEKIKEITMKRIHEEQKKKGRCFRRPAVVLLAAALGLLLSVTAFAAATGVIHFAHKGTDADFYDGAFGTGVQGQEAYDLPLMDTEGKVYKTEHYPAVERVEADSERAAALVGEALTDIDQGVVIGDLTFILRSAVMDENSIGVLTCELQNPEGLDSEGGTGWFTLSTESGRMMDTREYLLDSSEDGTEATYACYFTPFEDCPGEAMKLTWHENDGKKVESLPLPFSIENTQPASVRRFYGEGLSAEVSPVGLTLRYSFDTDGNGAPAESLPASNSPVPTPEPSQGTEKIEGEIVLRYADGSEYLLLGDDLVNYSVASVSRDRKMKWFAFNRLAEPDNLVEIQVRGRWLEDGSIPHTYNLKLTEDK